MRTPQLPRAKSDGAAPDRRPVQSAARQSAAGAGLTRAPRPVSRAIDSMRARVTPLSVLDLSPVTTATPGSAALRNSLDLARLADRLGYTRYWLAEHHNLPSIASSAPEIMIGQIAAATTHMRVGSGGVMLVNHAPLMVAERFKVLEALFPGRIDLGLGRAPGTDPVTSYALRRRQDVARGRRFPRTLPGTAAAGARRPAGKPSVPQGARGAERCRAAADLAARFQRLQRRARRGGRHGLRLCAPFRRTRRRPARC